MRFKIISYFILLTLTTSAYCSNFYASVSAGGVFPSRNSSETGDTSSVIFSPTAQGSSLFILPNVHWNNDFNNGFDTSLALGYKVYKCFRVDGEFLYQNLSRDLNGNYDWQERNVTTGKIFLANTNNPIPNTSSSVDIYSFLVNGYYDFINRSRWTPFIGGGAGVAKVNSSGEIRFGFLDTRNADPSIKNTTPIETVSPSLNSTAFAWQLKGGLAYTINTHVSIFALYRLFGTSSLKASDSSIRTNPNAFGDSNFILASQHVNGLLNNSIEGGLTVSF